MHILVLLENVKKENGRLWCLGNAKNMAALTDHFVVDVFRYI